MDKLKIFENVFKNIGDLVYIDNIMKYYLVENIHKIMIFANK